MATVPASGTLSMLGLAQEAEHGTYGSGSITGPISLYDLINGGDDNGSGEDYPEINTNCKPNPESRADYVVFANVYKHVSPSTNTGPFTFYLSYSEATTVSALANGDTVYTNAALTSTLEAHGSVSGEYWYQVGDVTTSTFCGQSLLGAFDTNSSGVVSNLSCDSP